MLLGLAAVTVALVWAVAGGRGLDPRFPAVRWVPIGLAGLAAQVAITRIDPAGDGLVAAEVLSWAALLATCLVNTHLPGMVALAAGVVANATVIVANAGMPVSAEAVRTVGGSVAAVPASGHHHLLDDTTRLPVLADTLGIGWADLVVSPGDALLVLGAVVLLTACLVGDVGDA